MPNDDSTYDDNRPAILKELDGYNTAPEFGMLGILQEQIEQDKPEAPPERAEKSAPVAEKEEPASPDYEKAYAPLNSSIQELGYRMDSRIADLERNVQQQAQTRQQAEQQQYPPNYDPEAPATMAHMMQLQQQLQHNGRQTHDAQIRAEYLRAHLELERFRQRNPDFNVTPQDLDVSFNRFMGNDLGRARNTNWTGHFAQIYESTAQPRMKGRIAELEKQVEELTKKGSRSESRSEPISPATSASRTATHSAIQSPATMSGELDVVNLPSFRKGKGFKSYANDIKRHLNIRNTA